MTRQLLTKNLLMGFLSWLIPFVASFFFFRPGGEMVVPYATFKGIITVVGVGSGSYLLYRYFLLVSDQFARQGIIVGISWMLINLVLDMIFLMPMAKLSFSEYLLTIGISYLSIPPIAVCMGYLLEEKKKT
ncbi:MAG: hypothetical protein JNN04_15170 [Cyclobacteriaceae bacterium]|nr:hypothetical protein [Cyclobacteriaceae bacterium]